MSGGPVPGQFPLRRGEWPGQWNISDTILYISGHGRHRWNVTTYLRFVQADLPEIEDWLVRNGFCLDDGSVTWFRTRREAHRAVIAALAVDPPNGPLTPKLARLRPDGPGRYINQDLDAVVERDGTTWNISREGRYVYFARTLRQAQIVLAQFTLDHPEPDGNPTLA